MPRLKSWFTFVVFAIAFSTYFTMSSGAGSYQYFKFVQQWPPTTCIKERCRPASRLKIFTIHGFWPSNFSNIPMTGSCPGNSFNYNLISGLANRLRTSWPNVVKSNNIYFWGQQWEKHGKCSDQTFGQKEYFQRADDIWNQYNITDILSKASIGPGWTEMNRTKIIAPIENQTKATPVLRCIQKTIQTPLTNGVPKTLALLHEVVICYARDGITVISCNAAQHTCPLNMSVILHP